jgi:hypothetical protein
MSFRHTRKLVEGQAKDEKREEANKGRETYGRRSVPQQPPIEDRKPFVAFDL